MGPIGIFRGVFPGPTTTTLWGHSEFVKSVAISPDGKTIVSAGNPSFDDDTVIR
jgi:WD40 repeat protein